MQFRSLEFHEKGNDLMDPDGLGDDRHNELKVLL